MMNDVNNFNESRICLANGLIIYLCLKWVNCYGYNEGARRYETVLYRIIGKQDNDDKLVNTSVFYYLTCLMSICCNLWLYYWHQDQAVFDCDITNLLRSVINGFESEEHEGWSWLGVLEAETINWQVEVTWA